MENRTPAKTKATSDEERFRLIQDRAYSLWEQEGKPDGDAARERFWRQAENDYSTSLPAEECIRSERA